MFEYKEKHFRVIKDNKLIYETLSASKLSKWLKNTYNIEEDTVICMLISIQAGFEGVLITTSKDYLFCKCEVIENN